MNRLLTDIISSAWLISDARKEAYAALILSLMNGEKLTDDDLSERREKNKSYATNAATVGRYGLSDPELPEGSIAVIQIRDEIMKYDQFCGPRGSLSIQKDIQAADRNPKIKSILLVIDSPGGQASYTDVLADTIKQTATPVVAFVEGMAASAAYWIASSAGKIIASSDMDEVGSIGTMLFFADLQPAYEEMGVVFHEVYASKSKDKNKLYRELRDGKYDNYREQKLDVINEKFHAAVLANRPNLDKSTLTGKMFFAPEAIKLGLIDEIGSFEYALEQANINDEETNTLNDTPMKITMKSAWAAIASFFSLPDEELETKELTEEMIGQLNDKLAEISTHNAELETQFQDERAAKVQLQEDLNQAQSALAEVTRQYEALKDQDAGDETIAGKTKDKIEGAEEPVFGHDKAADEFLGSK